MFERVIDRIWPQPNSNRAVQASQNSSELIGDHKINPRGLAAVDQ